jgi:hypothetical protein
VQFVIAAHGEAEPIAALREAEPVFEYDPMMTARLDLNPGMKK